MRDDFSQSVRDNLSRRVGGLCSNPDCRCHTHVPRLDSPRSVSIGVAAHICAAAEGGPRFDPSQSAEQRADIQNGIWLCQNCAKLVDNDAGRFSAQLLVEWRTVAEADALDRIRRRREPSEPHLGSQESERVASLTNQATPAEACLEFLRLENLHAPWHEMQAIFNRARFSLDESGARIGWDVVEISSASPEVFDEVLGRFAAQSATATARDSLTLHYLAAVLCVGGTAENEAAAAYLEAYAREGAGRYGLRLHIGFVVGSRYVDRVVAWA